MINFEEINVIQGEPAKEIKLNLDAKNQKFLEQLQNKHKGIKLDFLQSGFKISTRNFAGTIQIGKKRIEIRPKLQSENWNDTLFFLLFVSSKEKPYFLNKDTSYSKTNNFNNYIARQFINEVFKLISDGLIQNYNIHSERINFVRGRIDFKSLTQIKFDGKIPCIFFNREINIPENQLLLMALNHILKLKLDQNLIFKISELISVFENVENVFNKENVIKKISYNRLNEKYKNAHFLAKTILNDQDISFSSGSNIYQTFLVDMEKLFEDYLRSIISKRIGSRFLVKKGKKTIKGNLSNKVKSITLEPDIVITDRRTKKDLLVIDAKYKKYPSVNRSSEGVNYADLYQILSYSKVLKCPAILVYPKYSGSDAIIKDEFVIDGNNISISTIDIINEPIDRGKKFTEMLVNKITDSLAVI